MIGMSRLLARRKAIPSLLRSTLARFYRSVKPGNPGRPPSRRHNMHFESLEPRMLLSADFLPLSPMGSMVHESVQSGAVDSTGSSASTDLSYTLALDAGQRISVARRRRSTPQSPG